MRPVRSSDQQPPKISTRDENARFHHAPGLAHRLDLACLREVFSGCLKNIGHRGIWFCTETTLFNSIVEKKHHDEDGETSPEPVTVAAHLLKERAFQTSPWRQKSRPGAKRRLASARSRLTVPSGDGFPQPPDMARGPPGCPCYCANHRLEISVCNGDRLVVISSSPLAIFTASGWEPPCCRRLALIKTGRSVC